MPIQQTKKQSDLEKRLQLLRRQVYGKSEKVSYQAIKLSSKNSVAQSPNNGVTTTKSDLTYLNQDLLKIAAFSSIAIGVQVFLFFLLKNHILNFNFL